MGGAHQQQECRQLDFTHNCCFRVTSLKAVPNNYLLVRCVPGQLLTQPSGLTNALLRVPLLVNHRLPTSPTPFHYMGEEQIQAAGSAPADS